MDEQILNDQQVENKPEETSEQTEEKTQKQADDEEILSEEELEIQREIESYQAKIEALDAKIAEFEAKKIDDNKRELMRKYRYTDAQIERYLKFVEGETSEEIERSIIKLIDDIPPAGDKFADPSPMNGVKQKPKPDDPGEVGKTLFERIKHKIWGGGVFL